MEWKGSVTLRENRNLTPAPVLSTYPVNTWPSKLEEYYDDRFGFRAELVHLNSLLLHKYLRASNSDVIIGKDRWIFYAREDIFEDFFGHRPFDEYGLKRWADFLEARRAMLEQNQSHYLFVVTPDKNTVYPEKLPQSIMAHRGRSRWQQLKEYLVRTGSRARVLDLHEPIIQAKSMGTLYFPNDTHWNGRGYYVAYLAMCAELGRWVPDIRPQSIGSNYGIRGQSNLDGDWSVLGLPDENLTYASEYLVPLGTQKARKGEAPFPANVRKPPEPWNAPLYWEGPGRQSLLVLHDSYMRTGPLDRTQVPLAEHFARTLFVGMRPTDEEFRQIVEKFHPDVVIEEYAERLMRSVPPR